MGIPDQTAVKKLEEGFKGMSGLNQTQIKERNRLMSKLQQIKKNEKLHPLFVNEPEQLSEKNPENKSGKEPEEQSDSER